MLGAYIFIIVISSSWIDPLIIMYLSFFVFSQPLFQSLLYLIWVLLLLLSFGLYLHKISFSSPSLSVCLCLLFWGGSLIDNIHRGLVFVSIQSVFVFRLGHSTHLHSRWLLISMILLPFTLLFWVRVYTPFLCFLSREDPLEFVEKLVWWCCFS